MTDRVPGAPGQYKAVVAEAELQKMQAGEQFTITMTRDDQPITEGTPYSKAAVLPDELAQNLCPEIADPTPADALRALNDRCKTKAGLIYPLAAAVVPEGFLLCDGAEYDREEYPELFAAIGTIYGEGNGNTTFNVPNLVTRVPVGSGEGYELGATGGEAEHTLTVDEMPYHKHMDITRAYGYSGWDSHIPGGTLKHDYNSGHTTGSVTNGANIGADTTFTGGSWPHNNMQPYTVVNYIIATGKDTAVSVADIVLGAQAIPLGIEYGGTGATNAATARKLLGALSLSGGTMTGNINMDGHKLTGLAYPTDPTDAATMEFVQNRSFREYFGSTNDVVTYISFELPYPDGALRYLGIFTSMGSNGANANMDPCVFILETGYVPSDYRVIVLHGGNVNVSYVDGAYRFQFGSGTWTRLWLKTLG